MLSLRTLLLTGILLGLSVPARGAVFYGWDQGASNDSRLTSYPSAVDLSNNSNLTNIGYGGSHIWDDIATDGYLYYGWDQGTSNDSRLSSYPSAADMAANTNIADIGYNGSHIWDSITTDGSSFYGYNQATGRLTIYPSAADIAANTNYTNIGFGAKQTFEAIATDGAYFYGWEQGTNNNSTLYRYASASDFAADTNGALIGSSGSHIWDAIAAFTQPTEYRIDVNDGSSPTESGWTPIAAQHSGNGGTVTVGGVRFDVASADGARDRGGPDDLTGDFIFDDGSGEAVGLQIYDLPDGIWVAKVWSWDEDNTVGLEEVGIGWAGSSSFVAGTMTANPDIPFVFRFDSSVLPNGWGIYTREANSSNRSRFNALQLLKVPEPSTGTLTVLGLLSLMGYLWCKKSRRRL